LASVLSLFGAKVSIVCYSDILSRRDASEYAEFYQILELNVEYHTIDSLSEKIINEKVNMREYVQSFIEMGKPTQVLPEQQNAPSIVLIDEVDVFYKKRFYGNSLTLLSKVHHLSIVTFIKKIWSQKITKLNQIENSSEYKDLLQKFNHWKPLIQAHTLQMLKGIQNYKTHNYHAAHGKIGYFDETHKINYNHYHIYDTLFAYLNEHEKNTKGFESIDKECVLRIEGGSFSYAELIKTQDYILGVSGTLKHMSDVEDELLKEFKTQRKTFIPTMFPKGQLKFSSKDPTYFKLFDQSSYIPGIVSKISSLWNAGKSAVIVVFEDSKILEDVYIQEDFKEFRPYTMMFTEKDTSDHVQMTKRTSSGQITFITKGFGCGSDFASYDATVNQNGGVKILSTFFSKEKSEEIQIMGRTARIGNSGAFYLSLNKQSLIGWGVSSKDLEECEKLNNCYEFLDERRMKNYVDSIKGKKEDALLSLKSHKKVVEFQQNIYKNNKEKITEFLIKENSFRTRKKSLKQSKKLSHTIFALDASGSMSYDQKWKNLVASTKYLLQERAKIQDKDLVSIIIYSNEVSSNSVYLAPITTVLAKIDEILKNPPFLGTYFAPPIQTATEKLSETDLKIYDVNFLFLSDGEAYDGDNEIKVLCKEYASKGLMSYFISFGSDSDIEKLQRMSRICGVNSKFSHSVDGLDLKRVFVEFGKKLNRVGTTE
jgi:Mg-chelatase subunit ChlD